MPTCRSFTINSYVRMYVIGLPLPQNCWLIHSCTYHSIVTVLSFWFLFSSSHLVVIKPGPILSDALASSPILRAEDGTSLAPVGTGFEFGIDPSEDPELAMVSVPIVGVLHYIRMCTWTWNFAMSFMVRT